MRRILHSRPAPRLAALETRDTGKIIRETSAQIAYVAEYYRYFAGLADKLQGAHQLVTPQRCIASGEQKIRAVISLGNAIKHLSNLIGFLVHVSARHALSLRLRP